MDAYLDGIWGLDQTQQFQIPQERIEVTDGKMDTDISIWAVQLGLLKSQHTNLIAYRT